MTIKLAKSNIITFVIICLCVFFTPLFLNEYFVYLLAFMCITFITARGLDILIGLNGLFSLGQAGFAAIGAYLGAILEANAI